MIASDKFAYLPSVGLLISVSSLLGWFCRTGTAGKSITRYMAVATTVLVLADAEAVATRSYPVHWRDTSSLSKHMLTVTPNAPLVRNMLSLELQSQGKLDQAISQYRHALQFKPNYVEAHNNLGIALQLQGEIEEAIKHFRQALKLDPDLVKAHNNLALALTMTGKLDIAIEHFREAVRLKPDYLEPLNYKARILAMHPEPKRRDPGQAIETAKRAVELTGYKDAAILETLAAAFAEASQFDQAVKTAEVALSLATAAQADELANYIRKKIQIYRQAKP